MYILFDIGGTKMRIALSGDGKKIDDVIIVYTPRDFSEGIGLFVAKALELAGNKPVKAVVGGLAGPLDRERTMSINPPNLPEWKNKPFKLELEKRLNTEVHIVNDASLAGLGEAVYGAGKGKKIVAYMTISTGIGGARVVGGRIDVSSMGFEPGHQIVDMASGLDLEQMASGGAIKRKYGKKPREITDTVFWDGITRVLAVGISNTIVHWSPDIMILGGGMMQSLSIDAVRGYVREYCRIFPDIPAIEKSMLGDEAALYGALVYISSDRPSS